MQTQAYFDNIQTTILSEIDKAKASLQVAVAWLTDKTIFDKLCAKASKGVKVELLLVNDNINNDKAPFNHKDLETHGGFVYFIPPTDEGAIMHHKFCVIDNCTVITGSYNWSKKAQHNDENIIITWDACELGSQFTREFTSIKERTFASKFTVGSLDLPKIIKRLEIIKSFVVLEEMEEIISQVKKLHEQNLTTELIAIVQALEKARYSEAIELIEAFTAIHSQLVMYEDTNVFALQLEIKSLEIQLNALEDDKIETEKLIEEFSIRHTKELGELVLKLLQLRKQYATTEEEKAEATQDEKEYKESYEANKDKEIPTLNEEEQKSIKSAYREASMLCHPDKFQNEPEKQEQAEEIFKTLAEAYSNNDIVKVKEILVNLKEGVLIIDKKKQPTKKQVLQSQLARMKQKFDKLVKYIGSLKNTETYQTATKNTNWDAYFEEAKDKIQREIEQLQSTENVKEL